MMNYRWQWFSNISIFRVVAMSQAAERIVKLVTAASVSGFTNIDGMIRNTLQSRSKMPHFTTKRKFLSKDKQPRT